MAENPRKPIFKEGSRQISAADLNDVVKMIPRNIIGVSGEILVQKFGDRITIGLAKKNPQSLAVADATFVVMDEFDDYLLCVPFTFDEEVFQSYSPDLAQDTQQALKNDPNNPPTNITATDGPEMGLEGVYIAKPWILQRAPFEDVIVNTVTYSFFDPPNSRPGERNALAHGATTPTLETITPAYFEGEIIVARKGPTGLTVTEIDEFGESVTSPISWTDCNQAAREWSIGSGNSTGIGSVDFINSALLYPNIPNWPNFPAPPLIFASVATLTVDGTSGLLASLHTDGNMVLTAAYAGASNANPSSPTVNPGMVSTTTQQFAGWKEFLGAVQVDRNFRVSFSGNPGTSGFLPHSYDGGASVYVSLLDYFWMQPQNQTNATGEPNVWTNGIGVTLLQIGGTVLDSYFPFAPWPGPGPAPPSYPALGQWAGFVLTTVTNQSYARGVAPHYQIGIDVGLTQYASHQLGGNGAELGGSTTDDYSLIVGHGGGVGDGSGGYGIYSFGNIYTRGNLITGFSYATGKPTGTVYTGNLVVGYNTGSGGGGVGTTIAQIFGVLEVRTGINCLGGISCNGLGANLISATDIITAGVAFRCGSLGLTRTFLTGDGRTATYTGGILTGLA